ncbi:MAG: Argininosuccinate synthase [Candidatus Moanabacter tarae]|uniref:Argininosuccinate synthase n=1 Tax=Candidatus Moanibacter tarae TaxID=2200854 RepID=A0A2Z4ACC5_9BACT|nr:MAG: Argininosuccinate synthase [Candidatus Moanabacter tarae]|tara:strand:- start:2695 stop:3924 length:1230 start_codon:yes stop_codon:yes gene_type:complete
MKIVLAYSGGLDTSVILHWLCQRYDAEVVTYAADIGQQEELEGLEEKAKATGAVDHYSIKLTDEFARDFIYPMMRANTVYEGQYLLGTAIARPLIAKSQIAIAKKVGATALSHGATGKGNDQCRFEITYAALAPNLEVIAPWRLTEFREKFPGRNEMIEYCRKENIPVEASVSKPYSMDRNLLHISYEAGILEDPWFDPTIISNKDMFKLTSAPEDAPEEPAILDLEFLNGDCIALNSQQKTPHEVMQALNQLGGTHAIGRVDLVENRFVGMKSRGVYETPGGTILMHAHRQIESITMDRDLAHLRDSLISKYSEMIYYGFWFAPEREALQTLIDKSQEHVTGTVRIKLYKGNITTIGRKSEYSLYDPQIASMEADESSYDPNDASGFIRLQSLRLRARHRAQRGPDLD